MDNRAEFVEFAVGEGDTFQLNVTSLVSDLHKVFLDMRRKQIKKAIDWSQLSEDEQREEINAMYQDAVKLVRETANLVATADHICANVEITKFTVDVEKGDVTITSKGYASDDMLNELANAKGRTAKLIVVDMDNFKGAGNAIQPEPDQSEMFDDPDNNENVPSLPAP